VAADGPDTQEEELSAAMAAITLQLSDESVIDAGAVAEMKRKLGVAGSLLQEALSARARMEVLPPPRASLRVNPHFSASWCSNAWVLCRVRVRNGRHEVSLHQPTIARFSAPLRTLAPRISFFDPALRPRDGRYTPERLTPCDGYCIPAGVNGCLSRANFDCSATRGWLMLVGSSRRRRS
jgi:hypothetical protein